MLKVSLPCRLLDHPFYQQWSAGKINRNQLAQYAYAYLDLIRQIPYWWAKVQAALQCDEAWIVDEEQHHITLWKQWMAQLEPPEIPCHLDDTVTAIEQMSPSTLLGALYAFEVQQPEVSRTKYQGLIDHYGFNPEQLRYFEAHFNEERHVAVAETLAATIADQQAFAQGVDTGARLFYRSLDRFLQ